MNKRIITILLLVIFILSMCTLKSFARGIIDIEGNTSLKVGENTVELTLSLGDLAGFTEGEPLGFQGTLTYDENMFQNILVEGLNGWTVNYEKSTKTFMGETDVANANTQIAKVILTVKDGIEAGTSGMVDFNNILLTDGTGDFILDKEIIVTMEGETTPPIDEDGEENPPVEDEEKPGEEENVNNTINNNTSLENTNKNENTNTTTIQGNTPAKTTGTTATTSLPKAGLRNILLGLVIIAFVSMVVFKIKSKDIKY